MKPVRHRETVAFDTSVMFAMSVPRRPPNDSKSPMFLAMDVNVLIMGLPRTCDWTQFGFTSENNETTMQYQPSTAGLTCSMNSVMDSSSCARLPQPLKFSWN